MINKCFHTQILKIITNNIKNEDKNYIDCNPKLNNCLIYQKRLIRIVLDE
jgi:hypothetical protein